MFHTFILLFTYFLISGDYITEQIVADIKKNKFFSVLADEATDVSNQTQMALVLRYVDDDNEIVEKFVSFIRCENGTSGEALAKSITNKVQKIGKLVNFSCKMNIQIMCVV